MCVAGDVGRDVYPARVDVRCAMPSAGPREPPVRADELLVDLVFVGVTLHVWGAAERLNGAAHERTALERGGRHELAPAAQRTSASFRCGTTRIKTRPVRTA